MHKFAYSAIVTPDDDGFTITFPAVPEAIGAGDSRAEALAVGEDVLTDALLTYVEQGRDLPAETEPAPSADALVVVPADTAAKLAVWQAWRAAGISKTELARRMEVGENEARRILDPDHATKLPALMRAARALGVRLVLTSEDA